VLRRTSIAAGLIGVFNPVTIGQRPAMMVPSTRHVRADKVFE